MPHDYKKEQKELYQPKTTPSIVDVPIMAFIMIDGAGDPNTSQEYRSAIETLYGLCYTIKMSKKRAGGTPDGYFDYVVPPLEGLWSLNDGGEFKGGGAMVPHKDALLWTAMIRQPEFVTSDVFYEAKDILGTKKPHLDISRARLALFAEGLCVQALHQGPYDDEPGTVLAIDRYAAEHGYVVAIDQVRRHHEIYLSDPGKVAPEKLKTVIRHPIKEA
ncbi:MAG: GyrI-like domain-containing protein [Coriobacteriales bacterium]|jgi:hypothetical protein|nr:GyrI-like domain-containing protein [Coriobacteriales bacterium]